MNNETTSVIISDQILIISLTPRLNTILILPQYWYDLDTLIVLFLIVWWYQYKPSMIVRNGQNGWSLESSIF
jgi:hypothetical protein